MPARHVFANRGSSSRPPTASHVSRVCVCLLQYLLHPREVCAGDPRVQCMSRKLHLSAIELRAGGLRVQRWILPRVPLRRPLFCVYRVHYWVLVPGTACNHQRHPCTAHSLSDPGAKSREDCVCARSKFKADEICFDCPLDSFRQVRLASVT